MSFRFKLLINKMSLVRILDGFAIKPGISATIKQLVSGIIPRVEKNNGQADSTAPAPSVPVIRIDDVATRYLLAFHYRRPYSFVVFSSDSRQNAPCLYEGIEALRNSGPDKFALRLEGDRFYAEAECALGTIGHELRITMVEEQRSSG